MASLRQIRRRMKSIENIHEITKAMEMIAAFRFKRAEGRFLKTRAYFGELERLVGNIARAGSENFHHPLFEKRQVRKKSLIVMTGDKGLCGAYNTNLLRGVQAWLKENQLFEAALIPVGKVGCEFARRRKLPVLSQYAEKSAASIAMAKSLTEDVAGQFLAGRTDSVELLYTGYRSGGSGRNTVVPFLSMSHLLEGAQKGGAPDYIYEPGFEGVFESLLGRYMEGRTYRYLLESLVSEHAARTIAMKQATDNSEEILDSLKLLRNKTRQATITRELSEIVSGASILV